MVRLRALLALALSIASPPALAVGFIVDSTDDAVDAAIDGVCADAEGQCTLRAAVQEANATPGVDEIDLPAGRYVLKRTGAFEEDAASGDLDLLDELAIRGAGSAETIVQGRKDRVFDVYAKVLLVDVTVTKGKAPKSDDDEAASGGGIRNQSLLRIERVLLTRNSAADDAGALANVGGEIAVEDVVMSRNKAADDAGAMDNDGGKIELTNVTFEKNVAKDETGAFESEIGGEIGGENVTISGNKAKEAGGANAEQGGIISLVNATIARNKCRVGGCGVQNEDGASTFTLTNSIVADNQRVNCQGPITSGGGNLDGGTSCAFAAPGDQTDVGDAGLAKKLDTVDMPVHPLLPTSPAIDAALDLQCPTTDQNGFAREDVDGVGTSVCDAGAVEYHVEP